MNCRHSENELALYVEGDLPAAKAGEVDVHLLSCPVCRQVVDELRETQSAFKSIRQETVSPQALARVRTRVLGQAAAQSLRRGWGRWVYALAGVAFVIVAMAGVLSRYERPVVTVQRTAVLPPAPVRKIVAAAVPKAAAHKEPVRPRVKHRRASPEKKAAEPPKEIMVKLFTDDPNVVIYWLVDQNGGAL